MKIISDGKGVILEVDEGNCEALTIREALKAASRMKILAMKLYREKIKKGTEVPRDG